MRRFGIAVGCMAAVLVAIEAGSVLADTVALNAATDVWIRENSPGSTYEGDGVSVWDDIPYPGEDGKRYGAIEFDLSGVAGEITGAHIELFATESLFNKELAFKGKAALLQPHGIGDLTWTGLSGYTQDALDSLGAYDLPTPTYNRHAWYASGDASASDVSKLEALRVASAHKATLLLLSDGVGMRDWADAGYTGDEEFNPDPAPRLVLTFTTTPEPSTIVLLCMGMTGLLAYAWRKRR